MLIYCICTQYLVGAPFALITASIRRGMEVISLWHCWGGMEAQVALIAAFRSSALLGLVSLIFLLTIPHRFRSGEFAGQSSTVTPWSLNQLWYLWQCGQVPSPAGKWNQHLHKACQQKEAWSALEFPGRWLRWLWTSENTVDQHQQMTWQPKSSLTVKLHTGLQATWILCLSTLPPDSGTLISKWNAKFTFIWKEDFGPLSNSPVLFSTAQVRCFWRCLWFRSGLVALFLKTSEVVTLDALTPASVHSLWSSPKCLNQLCLTVFSSLRSSLLLVQLFLPKFFLPVNFAFNMLWYSTL